jgi:hypothetical protein
MQSDFAVIQMLRSKGDVPTLPHTLDHSFFANSEAPLAELAHVARLLMFEPSPIARRLRPDGATAFDLMLRSPHGTTVPGVVARQSILMAALAEAFGATYAGWGTQVVKTASGR